MYTPEMIAKSPFCSKYHAWFAQVEMNPNATRTAHTENLAAAFRQDKNDLDIPDRRWSGRHMLNHRMPTRAQIFLPQPLTVTGRHTISEPTMDPKRHTSPLP